MFDRLFGRQSSAAPRVEPTVSAPSADQVRAARPVALQSSASIEEWREHFGFLQGDAVTREGAMKLTAVFGCVSLLAGTVATLGAAVRAPREGGGSRDLPDHPVHWLMHHEPHSRYSPEVFFEGLGVLAFLDGNGYAEILTDRRGRVTGLRPLFDATVTPWDRSGRTAYRITENGDTYGRDQDQVLHLGGSATMDGLQALSPLKCFARSIGIGLDADEYARRYFKQGSAPSGYISYDGQVDESQANEIREYWMRKHSGVANSHLPAVLSEGGKFVSLLTDPETAQLFQSRSFQVLDVARAYGVPPHLIGETEKSTSWGQGINAQTTQFYILGLRKHIKRFEGELTRKLLSEAERRAGMRVKFNLDSLLRADLAARYEAHKIAVGGTQHPGWLSINEVREIEGLPPIAGDAQAGQVFRPVTKDQGSQT
ncbi:phage portal protein [Mameliella alba]|nr:phage portal protein [Antarctobacter heliothermus]MBY6143350.1 phage portal protein [Mameliella alba]MCA0952926.1 phage portal protein [Mameliella alba]